MHRQRILSICLLFLLTSLTIPAQPSTRLTPYTITTIRQVAEVVMAPDGGRVAYTVVIPRPTTDAPGADYRELIVMDLNTGSTKSLIGGNRTVGSLSWTPDGMALLCLGTLADSLGTQIWKVPTDGGSPVPVTTMRDRSILSYEASPDGGTLAYVATAAMSPERKALMARGFNAEVVEEDVPDRVLRLRRIADGTERIISTPGSVFDITWNPDGKRLAASIAPANLVDHQYMFRRIHIVDAATGVVTKLVENPGKLGTMRWSPDGSRLAFISAVDAHDSKEGSLYVIDAAHPVPFDRLRNYTQGFEGTVVGIGWRDATTLLFSSDEGVNTTLRAQGLDDASSSLLIAPGSVVLGGFSIAGGMVAFAGNHITHPNELFTFDPASRALTRRTTTNTWLKDVRLARQEAITYTASDGLTIEGILIHPLDEQAEKRHPLIVDIHGGPEACYLNGWVTNYGSWGQIAAARGFFVFMPNYRASTGRGVEFARMGFGDLAGREFTDVIDGIDRLVELGLVDRARVGIGGGSYGGYFSAWGATKWTDRFAAAVVFVGIANQVSKRNTTDIPWEDYLVHWGIWTHENPDLVSDRSPVTWAHQSRTPTLILGGKDDPRIHPSQGLELYRSLKLAGGAPVRLVYYPGEGHGNRRTPARLDYAIRTMEWFDYYLNDRGPKTAMPPKEPDYDGR